MLIFPSAGLMGCPLTPQQCRAAHIAPRLRDARQAGTDWEARCPVCGHESFRISTPTKSNYRNIWGCARRPRHCEAAAMRTAQLRLGIAPGCLGTYAIDLKAGADSVATAALREAVDLILGWPGLDPATIRIILAEARGDKIPDDYRKFARFAQDIGIGRANAYNLAAKHCRPSGCPPPPGEGSADA